MVNNYTYTRRDRSQVDTSQENSQKRKVGPDDYKINGRPVLLTIIGRK